MKIALLSTDNRQDHGRFDLDRPIIPTPQEALLQGFDNQPEIEVHFISCLQSPVKSPTKLGANVYYHGLMVPKIGWLRTGYQGCIRAVRNKLREIQPDIVHGQGTERDCAICAVFSGYPNVITIHGNMRLVAAVNRAKVFSFPWVAAKLETFVLPRTDGVVCISNYTRQAVESLAPRTWMLPNAVDASFFDLRPNPDPALPPVILCVGVVGYRKNQNDFIRALDGLASQRTLRVIFVGKIEEGAYGNEFRNLLKTRAWCEHVPFSGRDRVREYYQSAKMVALPTREDNCPMVVIEAMAAGVPVFASKVGGVPDLIADGVNGLLCDPARPESFNECVRRLLDEPEQAARLARTARLGARERFHPDVVAQRHLDIYREVLDLDIEQARSKRG